MSDQRTIEAYERDAERWVATTDRRDLEQVAWVENHRQPGPVVDIGCGPGWHLSELTAPAVGLDAAASMLAMVAGRAPEAHRLRALADRLPFASGSLGGAVANRVYLHLERQWLPLALADLHRALRTDGPVFACMIGTERGRRIRSSRGVAGRLFSGWDRDELTDVCIGAGFNVERLDVNRRPDQPSRLELRLRRSLTLPDTVGPAMTMLVCGLNPSIYSAEVGIGFGRPGNRFWPAAIEANLVSQDRDPRHALLNHGIGMTDMVKRATRRADELSTTEYRDGLARVERMVAWLQPRVVCFVGLAGWRAVVDRKAVAGLQAETIGDRPVYLMPSTSGLNASSRLGDLVDHLRRAGTLAAEQSTI